LISKQNPFRWKHFEGEIILLNVRWYCSYGLSYRNFVKMMEERGLDLVHTTIMK
jgi:transposase, IS6 family